MSHVAFLDGGSEITYNYGGGLDNENCEDIGTISGAGNLPVVLINPTHDIPAMPEGFLGLASLSLFENPGVKTWVIEVGAPGANGTYINSGCDAHNNEITNLLDSGLEAVDTRAAFGENGSVEGDTFESGEISPLAYTFNAKLTIPNIVPQSPHDPSVHPD